MSVLHMYCICTAYVLHRLNYCCRGFMIRPLARRALMSGQGNPARAPRGTGGERAVGCLEGYPG